MKLNGFIMTPTNSSPNLNQLRQHQQQQMSQSIQKLVRQSSVSSTTQKRNQYIAYQRRQNLSNDFLTQYGSSTFSVPLLVKTMNSFFQSTQTMEDEIMLPSRLKDMPVDEVVLDSSVQPDNWHEIYTFIRDMRNQLKCSRPFAVDDDNNNNADSNEEQRKQSNDDEGIILVNHENNPFSSASSTVSSDEYEQQSITSSSAASYETIKDELKYHYYGLLGSLDNLSSIANRVTENIEKKQIFKNSVNTLLKYLLFLFI